MAASVTTTIGPPNEAWTSMLDYDGAGNLIYSGYAVSSQQRPTTFTVSSYSKASPGVVTTSAPHGLQSGQSVTISGATGSWAALNGLQIITVATTTTFTIAVDTSAYAGTFNGVITTSAPLTSANVWAISKNYYDGSSRLIRSGWADGNTSCDNAWDSRANYSYA